MMKNNNRIPTILKIKNRLEIDVNVAREEEYTQSRAEDGITKPNTTIPDKRKKKF